MAERVKYQLTDEEVGIPEQAIRHDERPEVRQRATAIRMLHLAKHPSQVTEVLAVSLPRFTSGMPGGVRRVSKGWPTVQKVEDQQGSLMKSTAGCSKRH